MNYTKINTDYTKALLKMMKECPANGSLFWYMVIEADSHNTGYANINWISSRINLSTKLVKDSINYLTKNGWIELYSDPNYPSKFYIINPDIIECGRVVN